MAALTIVVLLALSCMAPNLYDWQWLAVAVVATLVVAFQLRHVFRWPLLVLGVYLAVRAAWAGMDVPTPALSVVTLRQTGLLGVLVALGYLVGHRLPAVLSWAVPGAAVATLVGYPPLYQNTSLNAALLVACLPFACHPIAVALVACCVVYRQWGATAYVLLPLWVLLQRSYRGAGLAALGVAGVAWAGLLWVKRDAFSEMARLRFYAGSWAYWREHASAWWGTGLGTFVLHGPKIQERTPGVAEGGSNWRSLHCDWGQLLFELGIVGLALGTWVYVDALRQADHATRVALVLLGVAAIGYFPMQAPLMAVYCVCLVVRAQVRR